MRDSIVGLSPQKAAKSDIRAGPLFSAIINMSISDGVSDPAAAVGRSQRETRATAVLRRAGENPVS